jgi:dolichol-phosphate mannosyltransferase
MTNKITVVIPTYKEAGNIEQVARRTHAALEAKGLSHDILFIDDNSQDGSAELCQRLAAELPVRIIVRTEERGLSTAVIRGIHEATGDYVVVMDADLSHPPEKIPDMVDLLESGEADFVVGSRYVEGGSLGEEWGFFRRLNSLVATWLALPLVKVRDPMSGFFAFSQAKTPPVQLLSPIGYKIGLELLVKGEFCKPREVPIHFVDRTEGESKMTLGEQIKYLRHLRRLYQYRYPTLSEFVHFGAVGSSGYVVDLAIYLSLQSLLGLGDVAARAISFWGAASWNWAANRLFTFPHRKKMAKLLQWPAFVLTSVIGFTVNVGSYYLLTHYVPFFSDHRILAFTIGVVLGMGFNFTASRVFVFRPMERND